MAEERPSRIPLPAPLRSTPVTALRRYYRRSDSCAGGSSARREHEHRLGPAQVSLFHAHTRRVRSVANHRRLHVVAFTRYPSARRASRLPEVWTSSFASRLIEITGRIAFVAYRPVTHLWLLPTSPRGDAVTISYGPESVCPGRTSTFLCVCAHRRTGARSSDRAASLSSSASIES